MGIWERQYQQNFFPGSASIGAGSERKNPMTNMAKPAIINTRPNMDIPRGTKKSTPTMNMPNNANMAPEATNPLYIRYLNSIGAIWNKSLFTADVEMITEIAKAPRPLTDKAGELLLRDHKHLEETLPGCQNLEQLISALRTYRSKYRIFVTEKDATIFRLRTFGDGVLMDDLYHAEAEMDSLKALVAELRKEFVRTKIGNIYAIIPDTLVDNYVTAGFERDAALFRLDGEVRNFQVMPILPLTNPDAKKIPELAELMKISYTNSSYELNIGDSNNCQKMLREVQDGYYGIFLKEASFVTGLPGRIVSVCLIASQAPEVAQIAALFTHPLYRARGLATIEVANSMRALKNQSVRRLTVTVHEKNEIARRLFTKLGFVLAQKLSRVKMFIK